jgi:beta-glucosidase-like glycosyl hydrolase
LKVYPNPFHSSAILIISSEFKIQKAELIIYDMLGNEVQKTEIQNQEAEVKNLSAGIYLLKVIDANSGRVAQIKLTVE